VVQDQLGSPTSTVDLALATLNLVDRNGQGIFHITTPDKQSWYGFAAAVLEEFKLSADLTPVSTAEWFQIRPKPGPTTGLQRLGYQQVFIAHGPSASKLA